MRVLEVLEACEGGTRTHLDQILTGLAEDCGLHFAYSLSRNPSYTADVERYRSAGVEATLFKAHIRCQGFITITRGIIHVFPINNTIDSLH